MKRLLKLMVLIILGVAVVVVGGVLLYLHFKPTHHGPKQLTLKQQQALQVTLPEMTTNLLGGGLVRFTLGLQANDSSTQSELKTMIPTIQDELNRIMRENTSAQLDTTKGLENLKTQIQDAVDAGLPKGNVTKVLFVNIVTE